MSLAIDMLLANIDQAVRNKSKAEIGGGIFDHSKLRLAAVEIRRLKEANERLEHDQKLLLEALKQLLDYLLSDDAKTVHDAIQVAKRANAAYRHVKGN